MGINSIGRRIRKTRRQLQRYLTSLLGEKRVQNVAVRELTDMADLNREASYLRCRDVFDPLGKTEAELRDEFNQLVLKHDAVGLKQRPAAVSNGIYSLIYEDTGLIEVLLGGSGNLNFANRLKKFVREKCLKDWMEVFHTDNPAVFDAFFPYTTSGCVGPAQYRLQTELKETPQRMTKLAEQIITQGIEALEMDPYA